MSWTFRIAHEGRGGRIWCSEQDGTVELPIELVGPGSFAVHLRGARFQRGEAQRALPSLERASLRTELRQWLNATGRSDWTVEG